MISEIYRRIQWFAEHKFSDILKSAEVIKGSAGQIRKLRLHLIDNTFLDVWYSLDGSYSFHWEQRGVRDSVYRHDNAPHEKWRYVSTFPKHCHDGDEQIVTESFLSDEPEDAIDEFLSMVRDKMIKILH